jgi:hypothetical protein
MLQSAALVPGPRHDAGAEASRRGVVPAQQVDGDEAEQQDGVEVRLDSPHGVLDRAGDRQQDRGDRRKGREAAPIEMSSEHQQNAQAERDVERGIDDHLQDRIPPAVGDEQAKRDQAPRQDPVFVMGRQQAQPGQDRVAVGREQPERMRIPFVPERGRGGEAGDEPQLRAPHRER